MVFQSYALYPHMTVRANIGFPLKVAGSPAAAREDEVLRAAEAVELEGLLDAMPAELSGGQRQRVAIARALVRRPGVFLMDEPLSNLDARLRATTRGRLKALQRELGVTTLYVTHDQQEAMALGDRIAVLSKGRIEQVAAPAELHARPANAFVARFAGSPPMNLLRVARLEGAAPRPGGAASRFGAEGVEFELPRAMADAARPSGKGTFLLGVRPEHVRIRHAADTGGFEAKVDAVEIGGRDALVYLSRGRLSFLALAGPEGLRAGDSVRVEFEPDRLRLFEDDGED
jgi:multiple sugar transport system ATP-binding protein